MKKYFLLAILLLTSCRETTATSEKLQVVASFYPIEFLVEQIAGEKVDLTTLVPSGVEPHEYELTPQDLSTISRSQAIIVNGKIESWFSDLQKNLENTSVTVLDLSQTENLISEEEGADPHFWLSPKNMLKMADEVSAMLTLKDHAHATVYEANTLTLKQKLSQLDDSYKKGLSLCEQKTFITAHAAFAYLAQDYGLTQEAIAGLSPEEEPSIAKLKELIDLAKEREIKVIFFESLATPDLANTLAAELGAETSVLNPIEGLTSEEQTAGEDYFTLMQKNLENLKQALICH